MLSGVLFALAAGLMWGLVFVGPLLLPEYPAALHTFGRYLAFGLIALPLAFVDRAEMRRLSRADWVAALKLAAIAPGDERAMRKLDVQHNLRMVARELDAFMASRNAAGKAHLPVSLFGAVQADENVINWLVKYASEEVGTRSAQIGAWISLSLYDPALGKVDEATCKIRDAGKIKARDRIAVLAALNLAFDQNEAAATPATPATPAAQATPQASATASAEDAPERLSGLLQRLDQALGQDGQLI